MEPIEQWKKEFISTSKVNFNLLPDEYFRLDKSGNFEDASTFFRFEGFCQAKRSQPVVELPKIGMCFGKAPFSYFLADQTVEALTAAGIQYRIKGE